MPGWDQDSLLLRCTVQLLSHLTPDERRAIAERKDLYSWAYEQARKQSDQKLFWDWSI
ncbi:MAG: hypothetical protein ACKO9Q_23175 [Pirellula sp.]